MIELVSLLIERKMKKLACFIHTEKHIYIHSKLEFPISSQYPRANVSFNLVIISHFLPKFGTFFPENHSTHAFAFFVLCIDGLLRYVCVF